MSGPAIANRMEWIAPFYVMDLLARAKGLESQGRSVIHMEVGEPDFVTPDLVIEAGKAALEAGHTGYTPATGIAQLRQAISDHYLQKYGVSVEPGRIIVTPGSSGALQLIMGVLVNPGDQVLMSDPGYPCNKNFVAFASGEAVGLPVGPESDYQLTAPQIEAAWSDKTRAVMVATPSNPTGTLISREEMIRIHQVVKQKGGILIVDEIYQGLIYGDQGYTALGIADDIFILNSFSKYFGMTGWRVGWVVAPEPYVQSLDCLCQNIFISSSAPAQHAALQAFSPDCLEILEERRHQFQQRRDFLLPALQELGFDIPVTPQGAFYLYANCSKLTDDSFGFAYDLLDAKGVAITPGKDFGSNLPEQHVRFAYTNKIENMQEGVRRIAHFLQNR